MNSIIKELLTGFAIGTANIIPGVSGGTFLLIFGIYEKVVDALSKLNKDSIIEIITAIFTLFSNDKRADAIKVLNEYEIPFLFRLLVGAIGAILSLSTLIKYLLTNHHTPTYGFFFGLILVSVSVPFKLFKMKPIHLLPLLVGVVFTVSISNLEDPVGKIEEKSVHYEQRQNELHQNESNRKFLKFNKTYSVKDYILVAFTGAIAISAMVLPGISGSLMLILLGQYFAVLTAISQLKSLEIDSILFLTAFSLGMGIGLLLFVKLVDWVFKKFHDGTMAFLTGLIIGSLWAIWPFKESVRLTYFAKVNGVVEHIENGLVYTNTNIIPKVIDGEVILTIITIIVGIVVMIPFIKSEK